MASNDDPAVEPDDPEYALRLLASMMRDESLPLGVRADCAREVLDRTRGRPRQAIEPSTGQPISEIRIVYDDDWRDPGRAAKTYADIDPDSV